MKRVALVLTIALVLVFTSCTSREQIPNKQKNSVIKFSGGSIERFIDEEAEVVCWIFSKDLGFRGMGGMSCLPLSQTKLYVQEQDD